MSDEWGWFREGQRIAEDTRRGGEADIEAIKASSIAFKGSTIEHAVGEPAPKVGGFAGDLAEMVRELENCRADHCEAAYKQNSEGGVARHIVSLIAQEVGLSLGDDIVDRNIWSPANMMRVVVAVQELTMQHKALTQGKPNAVAALREALAHLREGV
ncbi:hypothetical protein [Streptomyces pseudovenezuelae]|uniref:hypothetical protein n=1 Tax=Streptomyces pseudovenezuelae TaxID=67350 RepID=UPI002E31BD76|nr:hypothetical protein [Streptomyces pseudovenezuelae]